jgi:hypothetical protein
MPRPATRASRPGRVGLVTLTAVLVLGGVVLGGCAEGGSADQQVTSWINDQGGGSSIGNVEVDVRNVDLAIQQHNSPAAIREVCDLLSNDAQTGVGNLPSPDQELTEDLNNAFVKATAAGDDCYDGAAGNAALLARSTAERAQVATLFAIAVQRIEAITGKPPTTETTTPPDDGDPFAGGS